MSKAAVQAIQDEKLLAAAAWLFRRKGFAATTLREIAQAAGMLLGSVHYRYSTKDALLLALMERGIEHAIAAVQTAAAQSTDPTERIRLGLRAHLLMLLFWLLGLVLLRKPQGGALLLSLIHISEPTRPY